MRKILVILSCIFLCISLWGCHSDETVQVVATTLPVYEFTSILCKDTGISVGRLIDAEVSCLHDYSLTVHEMRMIESAELVVISGAGLEDFMDGAISHGQAVLDSSKGIELLCHASHDHADFHHGHSHENDPHIWLAPANAKQMATNIYAGLLEAYPQHQALLKQNFDALGAKISELKIYASAELANLSSRELITFHDGFSYLADAFDMTILHAIEEESGSEASAAELITLVDIVSSNHVKAIFTEKNSSPAAASVIAAETGVSVYALDTAMSGDSYFTAMYHNIDTLKEALK